MEYRCIFAGFGGQGIVSMGTLVACTAMIANRHTTYYPAYGIAQRGGTANCTVIVSDEPVASPVVYEPDVMVVMNDVSLEAFQSRVMAGGWLLVNASLTDRKVSRTDVKAVYVEANRLAIEGGDARMANMAMLGAVMKVTGMLPLELLVQAMAKTFSPKVHHLIGQNTQVLERGYAAV